MMYTCKRSHTSVYERERERRKDSLYILLKVAFHLLQNFVVDVVMHIKFTNPITCSFYSILRSQYSKFNLNHNAAHIFKKLKHGNKFWEELIAYFPLR